MWEEMDSKRVKHVGGFRTRTSFGKCPISSVLVFPEARNEKRKGNFPKKRRVLYGLDLRKNKNTEMIKVYRVELPKSRERRGKKRRQRNIWKIKIKKSAPKKKRRNSF